MSTMKLLLFSSFLMTLTFGYSQCMNWEQIEFDSFEYTTTCPYILPGTTYQTSPQPSPTYGDSHSGAYHVYLNFVTGYTGTAFDRSYDVCIDGTYRISFYHKDAWNGDNNTTFNIYDGNGLLLSSTTVPWTGSAWNHFVSPEIVATTTVLRLEIVNNITVGNNDMVVDDMTLEVCGTIENMNHVICSETSTLNLFDLFSMNMPSGGYWSGPSALGNGDLGTFDPSTNLSGQYIYTFASQSPCATPIGTIDLQNISSINLGNDTLICEGENLTLDAGSGFDFYNWSTGEISQSISVGTTGNYSVTTGVTGTNLVVNGDFESGDVNFLTDYSPGSGGSWGLLSNGGEYAITTSPSAVHNNFMACGDHSSGAGNMLVVNGSGIPGTDVWSQSVNVDPNTDYLFSVWITNALNEFNVANLQFFINGVQIGPVFSTSTIGCDWLEFNETWNSGLSTVADLSIKNQNIVDGGNDFAMDDVEFLPVCIVQDDLNLTIDDITVDAGSDLIFCPYAPEDLLAVSNASNATFSWDNGQDQAGITPTSSGTYIVSATSENNCSVSDDVNVTIIPMDWSIGEITSTPSNCDQNDGIVNASINGVFNDLPYFTWSGPGTNSTNDIHATVWENLSPGWYYFEVESDGCYANDSVQVILNTPPIASGYASPSVGQSPLSVTFVNTSQNASTFDWEFDNGATNLGTDYSDQYQVYTEPGTYVIELVAMENGCSDVAYINVVVEEYKLPATIDIPNVFTPNNDGVNDFYTFDMKNIETIDISILSRWGDVVYVSNSIDFEWDGKLNGEMVTDGVYYYIYEAKGIQGEEFSGHGFIHLNQ